MTTRRYVKAVLLGPHGVGKSTLARFANPRARGDVHPTIGVEYVPYEAPDATRVHLWDTSGNSLFRTFVLQHTTMCDLVLLVYDTSAAESLDVLMREYLDIVPRGARVLLIGTKTDLCSRTDAQIPDVCAALRARFPYVDYFTLNAKSAAARALLAEHINVAIATNNTDVDEPTIRVPIPDRPRRCGNCCVQ